MVYRLGGEVQLDDLSAEERLAFGAIVRLVASSDGRVDEAEDDALAGLADSLGADAFWEILDEAQQQVTGPEHARDLAEAVTRPDVRELIYGCACELAFAGAFSPDGAALLEALRSMWGIVERPIDP